MDRIFDDQDVASRQRSRPPERFSDRGGQTVPARGHSSGDKPIATTMDEKNSPQLPRRQESSDKPINMAPRVRVRFIAGVLAVLGCLSLLWRYAPVAHPPYLDVSTIPKQGKVNTGGLVPLEAHIISKCPDTRVRLPRTPDPYR